MDKRVFEAEKVTFHPMQNDALTEITTEDFKKFLKAIGVTETVVDFVQLKKDMEAENKKGDKKEGKKESKKESGKSQSKKKGGKTEDAPTEEEYYYHIIT